MIVHEFNARLESELQARRPVRQAARIITYHITCKRITQ